MGDIIDTKKAISDLLKHEKIDEFVFFCIARQGGRTALEILARAVIIEGKHAYIGQNLTGLRAMGTNGFVGKFSQTPNIPPGINVMHPRGLMFMHEALVWPDYLSFLAEGQLKRADKILENRSGLLMMCTSKDPEQIEYPVDFEGTVATVDAEGIFLSKVSIQPPPSGITSLGLFAAATDGLVGLDSLKEAVKQHDRLSERVRDINIECMQEAYDKTKVSHNIKLKGKMSVEEYKHLAERKPSSDFITGEEKGVGTMWKDKLPKCEVTKCVCIECLAAYFCPEGAIKWEDEKFVIDYDLCKGCGTCMAECPEHAITLHETKKVLGTP